MASADQSDRVREVVQPVVQDAGLYLEDASVSPAGARSVVRIVVDLDEDAVGGLDLDTLAEVSREVSVVLDGYDVLGGQYTLEVTTPGTDRPLTQVRHFKRSRGRRVTLQLRDGSTMIGRLLQADADQLVLRVEDGTGPAGSPAGPGAGVERVVAISDVRQGTVEVELSRRDDHEEV